MYQSSPLFAVVDMHVWLPRIARSGILRELGHS